MRQLDSFQTMFVLILGLWIMGFGFAVVLKKHWPYLRGTRTVLQGIWDHAWQFILGCAFGYFVGPRLLIHF